MKEFDEAYKECPKCGYGVFRMSADSFRGIGDSEDTVKALKWECGCCSFVFETHTKDHKKVDASQD